MLSGMNVQVLVPKDPGALAMELDLEAVASLAIVTNRRPAGGKLLIALARPQRAYEPFADTIRQAINSRPRTVDASNLIPVGIFDGYLGELRVEPRYIGALQKHLGRQVNRHEIEASDSRNKQRQQARIDARNAHLRGDFAREARIRNEHHVWHW